MATHAASLFVNITDDIIFCSDTNKKPRVKKIIDPQAGIQVKRTLLRMVSGSPDCDYCFENPQYQIHHNRRLR